MKKHYLAVLLVLIATATYAQITVTQSSNSQTLSQLLAGGGVTISNYTMSCATNGSGTFTNVNSNLGMPGGVVLASGRVSNIPNAANVFASSQFTANGDAQLSTLTSGTIYDPCVLQFDIVPQGPLLKFDYVFASEEYPEWVCSQFNDVFGFFITGPNPGGGNYTNKNIALINNTNLPVAINTINPGTPGANANGGTCGGTNQSTGYSSLYTTNQTPINPRIVYDGMTHLLTATAAVTPCQTYHLKIAIADVADRIYDSGVFLSAYSFNSNPVTVSAVGNLDYAGFSSAYEGCVGGTFTLTLSQAQTVDMYVQVVVSGTALNGTDYTAIPTSVLIPAGQTSVAIDLNPISDGIAEGMESVTIATVNPCTGGVSSSATINIRDNTPATISATDTTLCLGQSTQLDANGGINYSWTPTTGLSNPNIKNPVASPTTTTTYTCNMTFGACTKTVSQTIYVGNPAASVTVNPAGIICNGGNVQLTAAAAGVSPYSYVWSTGATTPVITVISGGSYSVTTTDAYGCSASANSALTISSLAISGTATNVSCIGGTNGAIDITVTGANAPFTYNWGGGIVSQDRNNLVAGTYTVTASNTTGCSVTASYTITQPASALTSSATNTPVTCNGGNNGSINLTPAGGVAPYTFAWSNSATAEDINSLTANSYSVTITDVNGCTTSRTVSITQPTAITTSETHVNASCAGGNGSINLSVSGGTGAYTYGWSNGANTQDISGISAGTYSVTVADANGCTAGRSVNITQPGSLAISSATLNPACFGSSNGTISLTVTGGNIPYTYLWSNGALTQNISGLAAGTFVVTVTDNNGCSTSASSALTQPQLLAVTATPTNVSCNGGNNGAITTAVTGGTAVYIYNWGGGIATPNRTNLSVGSYTVTVTDSKSCSATLTTSVTQPAVLAIAETHVNALCNGTATGSINITTSGGTPSYTYNWGAGITTEDRNNLAAGTYNVTATDSRACTSALSISISQPTVPAVTFTQTSPSCNGGSNGTITANASGGTAPYTYIWNNGGTSSTLSAVAAGIYNATVTDSRGCSVTGSGSITQPSAITITPVVSNASCAIGNDGTINITATGGNGSYSYNWGGGLTSQNRTGLSAGTYTITVTDGTGCTASLPVNVTQFGSGISLTATSTNVTCNGSNNGAINITVTGGIIPVTYNWGGGITTEDRSSLAAGTYSVTVTDGAGCSAIATNNIQQPAALNITKTFTNVLCNGANTGSITITANGGTGAYSYNWGGGITTQNRSAVGAGTYTVTVTDANLCTATNTTTITQPATALGVSAVNTSVLCYAESNGTISLTANGGTTPYTYSWNNGSSTSAISNLSAGIYTATVTDGNNCSTTITSAVTQPAAVLSSNVTATDLLCNGVNTGSLLQSITGGTAPYTFSWHDGVTTQNRTNLPSGAYEVTVSDYHNCTAYAGAFVSQPTALNIVLGVTQINCSGNNNGAISAEVSGGTPNITFNWGGGITSANRTGLAAGTYTVTVTDGNSCTASKSATITQPTALTIAMNSGSSVCMNATGTATAVTNNSGTAPYNYVWSNGGANTQTQNGLLAGPISVTITDANNCTASASVAVGLSGNNTNAAYTYTGVACGPNATLNFNHTGSNNVTHYWDFGNGAGTSTLSAPSYTYPAAGTYQVTHVVTRGYCLDSIKQTVTVYPKPSASSVNTNASCNGLNDAAINLSVTSGTSPFNYNWAGGITTEDRTGLTAGTYTVTVTDATPCSVVYSTTITEPALLNVGYTTTNITCNGGNTGAISLTATGGTPAYAYNWGGGITTSNRTGLTAGNYTVTVSDSKLCNSINTVTIYEPTAISITATITNVMCNAQGSGAIALNISGGTGNYTYNWGGGITSQNRTSLSAGNYSVTVKDANNCSALATAVVSEPSALTTTLVGSNVSCNGGSNGSISTSTSGGTAPYSYTWNDNNTGENRYTLSAGTYTVTVLDANDCYSTASTVVNQPASAVNVQVTNTVHVNCYDDNTGSISVNTTGGTPAYIYSWSDGSTLQNRINMAGGNYNLSITDAQGCQASVSAFINQPSQPLSIDTIIITNVLCNGSNSGSLTTTVSGGTAPYTYNWGGGIITANRINIAAGTYNVTVTDSKGCTVSSTATIAQPASALAASIVSTNPSCNGNITGSIDVTTTGGTTAYSYNWGGGVTTEDRTNISAGTYTVTITDANNCTVSKTTTLTQPTALNIAIASATNVSCFGGSNGSINTTTTGGTTAYTYNWGGNITTPNRSGLNAGTYQVTVTDANSCSASVSAIITQPVATLAVSVVSATNVACYGGNNGAITLNTTGGTTAYSYNWGGGVTSQNRNGLTAGNYNVTVTDANSCTASATATIAQPASALAAVIASTNPTCNGNTTGSINVTTTGGTTPYGFNWGGGITTEDRINISAGTYTVTITDANNCTVSKTATLIQPSALTITIASATNVSCFGGNNGSINTTTTGGTSAYLYSWGGNIATPNRTGLTAGTYQVTVTDANSCSASVSVAITQPVAALAVSVVSATNVACYSGNNGAITVNTVGGTSTYSYNWGGGITSQNRSGLTAGNYNVTVTDANSCTASATATITQPASALNVSITPSSGISCAGGNNGALATTVSGGTSTYTYNWGGGINTPNRTGLQAGAYNLTVTDANNCSAVASATLGQPQALVASTTATDVLCHGAQTGGISLSVSGGTINYTYLWNTGATTRNITNVRAGAYSVTITDAQTCHLVKSAVIAQPAPLTISTVKTNVHCYAELNGNIDNTITGGVLPYHYSWNTGGANTEDKTAIGAGVYTLTVSDANHCIATATSTITQPGPITIALTKTNPLCPEASNGSIDVTLTGAVLPVRYLWNTGASTEDLTGLPVGNYSVEVSDSNACPVTDSTILEVLNPLTVTETHTNISCNAQTDASITTHVTGGLAPYSYHWNNNASTANLTNIAAGTYSLLVNDANGCVANITALAITEPALLGVGLTTTNVACYGAATGNINTTVNGGTQPYQYHWSNNFSTEDLNNVAAGTYTFTVTDAHGCSQTASAFINTLPQLTLSANANELACYSPKGVIDLTVNTGTAPFTYLWNTGATTEDLINVYPGTYSVVVRDANNCPVDTAFVIVNHSTFNVDATGGGSIKLGETIDLHVTTTGSAQTTYSWTPTFGMPCTTCEDVTVQPGHTTLYTVVGIDTNGCEAQDTVSVEVIEDHTIFTPNAISPNGDGNNDVLQLYGNLAGIKTFEMMIFDRWGEKVFESTEPTFSWDGTYKGEHLGPTVCVYIMNIVFLDGFRNATEKGSITLLR